MKALELTFHCCGHSFRVYGETTGAHTDHCLRCDTANPETSTERVEV